MINPSELTPMMKQILSIKKKYPDSILMTRMGDFYEMFFDDAKIASRLLDITLTSRGGKHREVPLAGIPYHAIDTYISRLVRKGYNVTICDQLEDPKKAKGLVKRDVVRTITPGTLIDDNMLDNKVNNYIAAISTKDDQYGIAIADISTGQFMTSHVKGKDKLLSEISKFSPKECIVPRSISKDGFKLSFKGHVDFFINDYPDEYFIYDIAKDKLISHFNINSLDGFGLSDLPLSVMACGALVGYLEDTQKRGLNHINKIQVYSTDEFMMLDRSTQKNLELITNISDNTSKGTLLECLDMTVTSMGARLLRNWIVRPLINSDSINTRLSAVEVFFKNMIVLEDLRITLSDCHDIERIISRVSYGNANPRDIVSLKTSLLLVPKLKRLLVPFKESSSFISDISSMDSLSDLVTLIDDAISENPPILIRDGGIIKVGYNKELDELREISSNGKKYISLIEDKEREQTGIKYLKIRFNKVFGYYIEITNKNSDDVPNHYIRKQTLVNAERFITEELKELESKILGAEEKINGIEYNLFQEVIGKVSDFTVQIQDISQKISRLDVISSFSKISVLNNYVRPTLNETEAIEIIDGRHPVVELMQSSLSFIPNNTILDNDNECFVVLTGPNMAGKSTYMRQVALIVLMSQVGCFVPAKSAKISVVDRIFTRVGAHDDLASGQSTFMIEMNETANILNNATSKSLIIFDEIGRGTSTFDGLSIAWSVAEYVLNNIKAKTIFATHYHVMSRISEFYPQSANYHISVKEIAEEIIFLRKVVKGSADKSYGIQVAKLAGLPEEVTNRALEVQDMLESNTFLGEGTGNESIPSKEKVKDIGFKIISKKKISRQKTLFS
ncbi:MAG: DNA mismatch repair protein MutS [DPANN group archaeon]|nr:DNA mismatch repair protein MutS [DPANN group archaeon]